MEKTFFVLLCGMTKEIEKSLNIPPLPNIVEKMIGHWGYHGNACNSKVE